MSGGEKIRASAMANAARGRPGDQANTERARADPKASWGLMTSSDRLQP